MSLAELQIGQRLVEAIARRVLEESRVVGDEADWLEYDKGARWDLRMMAGRYELRVVFLEEELEDLPATPELERRLEQRIRDCWRAVRSVEQPGT